MEQEIKGRLLPGYAISEYNIVLLPHEELRNKILRERKNFADTYRTANVSRMKPHVSLVHYRQYDMLEEKIIRRLQTIAMGYYPVKIELKDYGSFPTHTIYINVNSKLPLQQLLKEIRSHTQGLLKLNEENKAHFISEPYISIARKLLPWQYEKAWQVFSQQHFTGRFIADAMLLLKRPFGESNYQILRRFEFQNLPLHSRQADLFC